MLNHRYQQPDETDPRNDEWKPLWAIFWRVLILVPVLWILGLGLLVVVLAAFMAPPFYSILAFVSGDYFYGIAALIGWLILLRFRKQVLHWLLDGIEYSGT